MKKKKRVNRLVYIVNGIIAVVIVGVIVSLFCSKKEAKSSPNNSPSDNFIPNSNGKLNEPELEKYLLEKRLELKKYFVLNLGREVESVKGNTGSWADDERPMNEKLSSDLTKLADDYLKQLEKNPQYEINRRFNKDYEGKDTLSFGKKCLKEWEGNELNRKIDNGKNRYIIFEKNEPELFFHVSNKTEKTRIIGLHEYVTVPIDTSSCHVFKEKSAALGFLKDNDPALKKT